jgi:hypothetical protein
MSPTTLRDRAGEPPVASPAQADAFYSGGCEQLKPGGLFREPAAEAGQGTTPAKVESRDNERHSADPSSVESTDRLLHWAQAISSREISQSLRLLKGVEVEVLAELPGAGAEGHTHPIVLRGEGAVQCNKPGSTSARGQLSRPNVKSGVPRRSASSIHG